MGILLKKYGTDLKQFKKSRIDEDFERKILMLFGIK